jgi:hypothetical protein
MKACGSHEKLRERSEHQPHRRAVYATPSPTVEVCS